MCHYDHATGVCSEAGSAPPPSPSGSKGLFMPDPIRPLAFLSGSDTANAEEAHEPVAEDSGAEVPDRESAADAESPDAGVEITLMDTAVPAVQLGLKLARDPYGRDAPRRGEAKSVWSPEPLAKYLTGVASKIYANIQNQKLPSAEKLDAFINRLVSNTHRQLRHAPKKVRDSLKELCARFFSRFWNFVRNEKLRNTTPEELSTALLDIVEALRSEEMPGTSGPSIESSTRWHCDRPDKKHRAQPKLACLVDAGCFGA